MACHKRLHARALRPSEWFNLVKRHGWTKFLLHDDFYDEGGTACQPEEVVEHPEDCPAPSLAAVAHDARRLLDYSIARWQYSLDVATAWSSIPCAKALGALSERFSSTSNAGIRSRVLEICASALRESGADLVRYAWGDYPSTVSLPALAQASAACLPFRDGFFRVTAALAEQEEPQKRDLMSSLGYFHSPETLDWIEQNIFEPITEEWGRLAAASQMDWPRAKRWFECGRPHSLVAIDALAAIVRPQTAFLRAYEPRLHQPPTGDGFRKVLSAYAERDGAPRVQQRIAEVLSHANILSNCS